MSRPRPSVGRRAAIVSAGVSALILVVVGLEWQTIALHYELWELRRDPSRLAKSLHAADTFAEAEALRRFVAEPEGASELLRGVVSELEGWYLALFPKRELLLKADRLVFGLGRKQSGEGPPTHFAYTYQGAGRSSQYTQSREIPPPLSELWTLVPHADPASLELPGLPGLRFTRLPADDPRVKERPAWPLAPTSVDAVYVAERVFGQTR